MNEFIDELENIACKNDITILDVYDLDPSTSDSAIVPTRSVFMNYEYNKVSYAFRLAHELSHIIYGDRSAQQVYHFSEFGKRSEELSAHCHAIEILMNIQMPTSPITFMKYFKVPSWLLDEVTTMFNQLA